MTTGPRPETSLGLPYLGLPTACAATGAPTGPRRMVRENVVTADDLIWPLFLVEGERAARRRALQPGVERLSVDEAVRAAVTAADAGIPALCFFPMTDPAVKDPRGLEATNPDNLVCRALRAIKAEVPHIGLMTDAALDLYTTHGHDRVMAGEEILNDAGRPRCACLSGSGLRRQTWPFQSWRGAATMRQ